MYNDYRLSFLMRVCCSHPGSQTTQPSQFAVTYSIRDLVPRKGMPISVGLDEVCGCVSSIFCNVCVYLSLI